MTQPHQLLGLLRGQGVVHIFHTCIFCKMVTNVKCAIVVHCIFEVNKLQDI